MYWRCASLWGWTPIPFSATCTVEISAYSSLFSYVNDFNAALQLHLHVYFVLCSVFCSSNLTPCPIGPGQHQPLPPAPSPHTFSAEDTGHCAALVGLSPSTAIPPCWVWGMWEGVSCNTGQTVHLCTHMYTQLHTHHPSVNGLLSLFWSDAGHIYEHKVSWCGGVDDITPSILYVGYILVIPQHWGVCIWSLDTWVPKALGQVCLHFTYVHRSTMVWGIYTP